jgi:hypothetical protein
MKVCLRFGALLALLAPVVPVELARAQAPCAVTPTLVDSARDEVGSVLGSNSPLVQELRQEQKLPKTGPIFPVTVVRDRFICGRLATAFKHDIPPGVSFVVLRVGPLYYAREPDQRRGTGIVTDSTFNVLLRLGVSIATPPSATGERGPR